MCNYCNWRLPRGIVIERGLQPEETNADSQCWFFQKSSEDKTVLSEPRYVDTGSMFDHAERLNLIFTLFTGEIVQV